MERLTMRRGKDNMAATPKKAYEEYAENEPIDCITFCKTQEDCMNCPIGACFDKLADYEDLGMDPHDLSLMLNDYGRMSDRLADYEDTGLTPSEGKKLKDYYAKRS